MKYTYYIEVKSYHPPGVAFTNLSCCKDFLESVRNDIKYKKHNLNVLVTNMQYFNNFTMIRYRLEKLTKRDIGFQNIGFVISLIIHFGGYDIWLGRAEKKPGKIPKYPKIEWIPYTKYVI